MNRFGCLSLILLVILGMLLGMIPVVMAEETAIKIEAEEACASITGPTGITAQLEKARSGDGFSGGKFSFVNVISTSDNTPPAVVATFHLTLPSAGTYTLSLTNKDNPDRGIYELAVDGVVLSTLDFYNKNAGFVTHPAGAFEAASATVTLTLTCVGANDASNKKYGMALDYITLTPGGAVTPNPDPDPDPNPDPEEGIHTMEDMLKCTYSDASIQSGPLRYRLYVPADYDETKPYPLLVYLNGAGSRGEDNEKQLANLSPLITPLIDNPDHPCIIAVPQLPGSQQWVDVPWVNGSYEQDKVAESKALQMLRGMIADLQDTYTIDSDRLYLMGQSFGGFGTWDAITRYPDLFAAAVPMCGSGDPTKAEIIKDLPLLVLHGSGDGSVPVSGSREMVAALKEAGSAVTYLEYEDTDHYIQRRVFEQPALWMDWLFAQKKGQAEVNNTMTGVYPVGKADLQMFNSGGDTAGWSYTGTFGAGGSGELKSASGSNAIATLKNKQLADGMVSGHVTIAENGAGGGGLVFRHQDDNNYVHLRLVSGGVELLEMVNGAVAKKHTATYAWTPGRIALLKAELIGNRVVASVDNIILLDVTLQTAAFGKTGGVGLRVYNGSMKVDDFVAAAAPVVSELTVEEPADRAVIQRDAAKKTASVIFAGKATLENVAGVELKIEDFATGDRVVDYTPAALDADGGYTLALTLPQGGWYRVVARALDTDGEMLTEIRGDNRFGVGINILCIGQSNMVGQGQGQEYVVADDLVSNFKNEVWEHLVDPYAAGDTSLVGGGAKGGSMVPTLGNLLVEQYNIPVGFIPAAQNGASLLAEHNGWLKRNQNNPTDRTTLYGNALYRANAAGGIEFILMNQGENNVSRGTDAATYKAGLEALQAQFAADLGTNVPIIYCQLGAAMASSWDNSRDPYMSGIRAAQAAADNGTTLIMGAVEIDLTRNSDNLHFDSVSQIVLGQRMANAIAYALGDAEGYKAPTVSGAVMTDATTVEVTVTHGMGADLAVGDAITGFEVFADGEAVAITSVAKTNATTLTLTLQEAVSGDITLRYLYGCLPDVSGLVRDNSALALPLLPVDSMAVTPYVAPPVIRLGDVDQSGEVTAADALLTLQGGTHKVTLSTEQQTAADVDQSGEITATDALLILQ